MGRVVDFLTALCARRQAVESDVLSSQRIEYLRHKLGTELYNVADRMPVADVLVALDLIRQDVERHGQSGGRII